jgi:hypothetical protein
MVMVLSYLQKSLNTQVKLSGESGRPTTDDRRRTTDLFPKRQSDNSHLWEATNLP